VIFQTTAIAGVVLIEPERLVDERGYFARTYSVNEFAEHGLNPAISQCSVSYNAQAGTLRGMHFQAEPHAEDKLVRCTRGAIFDVALDLRPASATYLRWHGAELSAENGQALFVPVGCAHGFQTLQDDSEVLYQISTAYEPSSGRGVRWNDPAFAIAWPEAPASGRTISGRDAVYPDFTP
jgi:dTDP-4-dehydrorhamnose 3,5-epimerase